MVQRFRKPGWSERFGQLAYLLKNTVTIVGRDRDVIRPWLRMSIYAVIMVTALFGGVAAIALGAGDTGMWLLFAACAMFVYKYFYYTRQEMAESWLVAEAVRGRDAVPGDGRRRVSGVRRQARQLAWIMLAFGFVASQAGASDDDDDDEGGGGGILAGIIIGVLLAGLSEVLDLAEHFLVPAVAIDGVGLREGTEKLKDLRQQVPETLVGVFGIDIAGGAVRTLALPLYLVLILGAVALGFMVGDAIPAFYAGDLHTLLGAHIQTPAWMGDGPLPWSWLPLLIAIWLGKMISVVLDRLVDAVKVSYFTLFYLRIAHPGDITPDLRGELDGYLRLEDDATPGTAPAGETT